MGILINTGFDLGSSSPIDNRTLKDTTVERDGLVSEGKVYENLKVYCKDTQTEYRWTGTEWEEVGTGGTVDLSEYTKTYTSLTELGLTADATVQDVIDALPVGDTALLRTDGFTNWSTLFNGIQWGYFKVEKTASGLSNIELQEVVTPNRRYFGTQAGGNFVEWVNVQTQEIVHTSLSGDLSGITTTLNLINALITEYRAKSKPVRFISGRLTKTQLTDLPSNYGLLDITVAGYDLVEVRFAQSELGFKKMFYGFLNRTSSETLFSKLTWSKSNNIYYTIDELNAVKGTNIELVKDEDNTIKIIEALSNREEFVSWYNNGSTMDRFGIPDDFGNKITYLRIIKTDPQYALIIATTSRGFTFSRVYNLGVLEDWCYDRTKATLVTNTTTLKLDVTKRNAGWFGAIKLTYLYDTSPAEIEISFRAATEDLRWAVINGQKYIKKITFTQDSSNTSHYTIGIEFSGTTYGCYQAEVIGGFADINSLTSEAFTGEKTAVYYAPWGKNNGVTLVSAPGDIGLTFPCTTVQLVQAMRNKFNVGVKCGAIGLFNCERKASTITDAPSDYGLLHVETFGHDRLLIRFDGIGSSSYTGSWIGQIQGNNGTFNSITWDKIIRRTEFSELRADVSSLENHNTSGEKQIGYLNGSALYERIYKLPGGGGNIDGSLGTLTNVNVISITGVINIGTSFFPIPHKPDDSTSFEVYIQNGEIVMKGMVGTGYSTGYVTIKYTKK